MQKNSWVFIAKSANEMTTFCLMIVDVSNHCAVTSFDVIWEVISRYAINHRYDERRCFGVLISQIRAKLWSSSTEEMKKEASGNKRTMDKFSTSN